jgi:hypothetical protein
VGSAGGTYSIDSATVHVSGEFNWVHVGAAIILNYYGDSSLTGVGDFVYLNCYGVITASISGVAISNA